MSRCAAPRNDDAEWPYSRTRCSVYENPMARTLIIIGLAVVAVGLLWPWLTKIGLGRLPGDIVIERGNTSFYFPIVTCVIISLALSLVLWLFGR